VLSARRRLEELIGARLSPCFVHETLVVPPPKEMHRRRDLVFRAASPPLPRGTHGSRPEVERDFPGPPRAAAAATLRFLPLNRSPVSSLLLRWRYRRWSSERIAESPKHGSLAIFPSIVPCFDFTLSISVNLRVWRYRLFIVRGSSSGTSVETCSGKTISDGKCVRKLANDFVNENRSRDTTRPFSRRHGER